MDDVERRRESERQEKIEARSGISSRSMGPGLDLLHQHIQSYYSEAKPNKTFKDNMARSLTGLTRLRMPIEEAVAVTSKFSKGRLETFKQMVDINKQMFKEKFNAQGQVGSGDSYWEVANPNLPHKYYQNKIKNGSQEAGVQYKEYFTFVPTSDNPDELLMEILKFYDALLRSYQRIQELGREKGQGITLKYHDNLVELLLDLDSIVAYVPDPETGKRLREVIESQMATAGVVMKRKVRSASGFDMQIGAEEFSHRQLTAKVIANVMDMDYRSNRKLAGYNRDQLAVSIIQRSEQAAKLTPEEMLQAI